MGENSVAMSEDSQIIVPQSFIDLYLRPGSSRPSEPREVIVARYEFCEDLATALTDHARTVQWQHGATEHDVLERILKGLREPASGVNEAEAWWVTRRLAELLDWGPPGSA